MIEEFINGLLLTGSLILAIGAQNAFLLKNAVQKNHAFAIATTCLLCDVFIFFISIFGVSGALSDSPIAIKLLTIAGIIFIIYFAITLFISAYRGKSYMQIDSGKSSRNLWKALLATLAVTLLNPHFYVDSMIIIGGISVNLGYYEKISFFAGCVLASSIWFYGIAYGVRLFLPLFQRKITWVIIDLLIGFIMLYIAYSLYVNSTLPSIF